MVTASTDIADYLLPDGKTIVSFKGKGVDDSVKITEDGHQVDVPIILLVNGESASASEVLTGALKDKDVYKRQRRRAFRKKRGRRTCWNLEECRHWRS